jgi:hypothetical protein
MYVKGGSKKYISDIIVNNLSIRNISIAFKLIYYVYKHYCIKVTNSVKKGFGRKLIYIYNFS